MVSPCSRDVRLFLAKKPGVRRRWLSFHRIFSNVLYVAILPHILIKGFGGVAAIFLIIFSLVLWKYNSQIAVRLKMLNWPLRKVSRG